MKIQIAEIGVLSMIVYTTDLFGSWEGWRDIYSRGWDNPFPIDCILEIPTTSVFHHKYCTDYSMFMPFPKKTVICVESLCK